MAKVNTITVKIEARPGYKFWVILCLLIGETPGFRNIAAWIFANLAMKVRVVNG